MQPVIKFLGEQKMIGIYRSMSLIENRTGDLWRSFMPRRQEIKNVLNSELISLQIYNSSYFRNFNPGTIFTKWAGCAVKDFSFVPAGMSTLIIPQGKYAIFHYTGSSKDTDIFRYIFNEWLPQSGHSLDDRPHFEILGDRYSNETSASEESICIPIKG
jgi:AraC family transcriptional regulator